MDFQVQKLASKNESQQKTQDDLDLYVGLKSGLDDPFNLYLRVSDLTDKKDLIYFYAYSLGKKKVVIWGVYDKNNDEFLIDNACKYSPNNLLEIVNSWKKNDYSYFLNSVLDRVGSRIKHQLLFDNVKKEQLLFDNFKNYFLAKLVRMGLTSLQNQKINQLSKDKNFDSEYDNNLNEIVKSLSIKKRIYLNTYSTILDKIYEEIDNQVDEKAVKAILNSNQKVSNPYAENLARYLFVTLFIMIFADMDIYRTAKYISHLEDSKVKAYLKESFFYHWILELSKILGVYDTPKFMKKVSKSVVDIIEQSLNRTDLGNDNFDLANIGIFFQEFLEKSIYSKVSYANNLQPCPSFESCELDSKEECNLYSHGSKNSSKYDMT